MLTVLELLEVKFRYDNFTVKEYVISAKCKLAEPS